MLRGHDAYGVTRLGLGILVVVSWVWTAPGCKKTDSSGEGVRDAATTVDGGGIGDGSVGMDAQTGPDSGLPVDHDEQADESNNGFESGDRAEQTSVTVDESQGLVVSGTVAVVADGEHPDVDSFRFDVAESVTIQVHVTWNATDPILLAASVATVDGTRIEVIGDRGASRSGELWSVPHRLDAGSYVLTLENVDRSPTAPISYRMELLVGSSVLSCQASQDDASYREADEAGHRNDWMTLDVLSLFAAGQVADATDVPEETGLQVTAASPLVIEGTSAAVSRARGFYLDGDAFLIRTGPALSKVGLSLQWAQDADVDLDMVLAPAESVERFVGLGFRFGLGGDGLVASVEPDTTYVVWVAARDDRQRGGDQALPLPYRVTVCGW